MFSVRCYNYVHCLYSDNSSLVCYTFDVVHAYYTVYISKAKGGLAVSQGKKLHCQLSLSVFTPAPRCLVTVVRLRMDGRTRQLPLNS